MFVMNTEYGFCEVGNGFVCIIQREVITYTVEMKS